MSEDLIKRSDAIDALKNALCELGGDEWGDGELGVHADDIDAVINGIPTIEPKAKVVAQVTFDEEKLREIVKEAVERFKEEYEIVDRPQGEWIDIEPRLNRRRVNKYKRCSHCGFSWARPFDDNYCPSCGARMLKGADDDL